MTRELPEGLSRRPNFGRNWSEKCFQMRLRCSDTVRGVIVAKNSNLMKDFDTMEGIQPITRRVCMTSDTLWYSDRILIAQEIELSYTFGNLGYNMQTFVSAAVF